MINEAVIRRFLARSLNSYDWLKSCTPLELEIALKELTPPPSFGKVPLWQHQRACFILLEEMKRFMLHVGMGGGKTRVILELLKYRKQCGEAPKAIVFVPYLTAVETWVEEVSKHAPSLKCVPLTGSTSSNKDNLRLDGDVFAICYQSAVAMLSTKEKDRKGKNRWQITAKEVRETFEGFDTIILDEVHKCKNVSSLTYRMCRAISAQCEYSVGLTGTPFGRDLTDLWPQFYLIDFGESLGDTLGFYKEVFFNLKRGHFTKYKYTFNKKLMPDLQRMIKHSSIHYDINEFADMPPKRYIPINMGLPDDYRGYCEAAKKAINNAAKRQGIEAYRELESSYLQLRQLASGFMTLKGNDTKLQVKFLDNPKLDKLEALIDALPYGQKMVVFHHFVYTSQMISERLDKMGVGHARIWGCQRYPLGELRRFKRSAQCVVLVLNDKSGSSSLNLQHANYVVFFEQPESAIDRQQAESRVWRPGQNRRTFIYDLFMKDTADQRLHGANRAGANLLKQLMKGEVL